MVLNNNGNGPTQNVAMSLQPNLADSGDYVNLIDDDPPPPLSYANAGGRFVLEWPVVQQQRRTASVERMEPKGNILYNESNTVFSKGESFLEFLLVTMQFFQICKCFLFLSFALQSNCFETKSNKAEGTVLKQLFQ